MPSKHGFLGLQRRAKNEVRLRTTVLSVDTGSSLAGSFAATILETPVQSDATAAQLPPPPDELLERHDQQAQVQGPHGSDPEAVVVAHDAQALERRQRERDRDEPREDLSESEEFRRELNRIDVLHVGDDLHERDELAQLVAAAAAVEGRCCGLKLEECILQAK